MMGIKKQKIFLALLLIFSMIVFFNCVYFLIHWLPSNTIRLFGEPDSGLDKSRQILLSAKLLLGQKNLTTHIDSRNNPLTFSIDTGQSASEIAENLESMNIIPNADSLIDYWIYKGQDRLIQKGVYLIQPDSTPLSIAINLANISPEEIRFAFLAGWRKEEVEKLLVSTNVLVGDSDFQKIEKTSFSSCFPSELQSLSSIEGFLFPDEYQLSKDLLQEDILCIFVDRFFEVIPSNYEELVNEQGFSLYEAVILASIVQREVVNPEEAPIIAGIFINRLNANMPLQSDPTIQYAIAPESDPLNWWKSPLNSADLQVDSPYNTYVNNGLPPSPICNPNLNSLLSIASPEKTNYLYFHASCDESNDHVFSETYQQHIETVCDDLM